MKVCVKLRNYEDIWESYIEKLKKKSQVEVICSATLDTVMEDVTAIITTNLSISDIKNLPNLKKVFLFKTGMDGLPVEEMNYRGIDVCPSYANAGIIGEHAITLALALIHRTVEFDRDMRNDIWFSNGKDYYWTSIGVLKIGILGFGHIGKEIYKRVQPFTEQIKVINKSGKYDIGIDYASDVKGLLNWCDLLFICVPKTSDTEGLIGDKEIQLMENKFIVNISRAEICDEKALYNSLTEGRLKGYASDVWYCLPDKNERTKKAKSAHYNFNELKNVILSPHCATHEYNAHERYINDAVTQCLDYIMEVEENVGI